MSNLLKSKFLIGVMTFAIMFVGAAALTPASASADCTITTTLRLGSTGAEVACLQTSLGGLTADGKFGPMTQAAVMAFQRNGGLVADGVFGPISRALWMSNAGNSANFPAGCVSATGFSTTTGMACYAIASFPPGCNSNSGFSSTTGLSCSTGAGLPAGCTSTSGFSPTTGMSCSGGSSPSLPAGCTSTIGFSPTTGASCSGGSTGGLSGTFGTIDDVNILSQYNSEEVGEGQNDVKVLGFEVVASNDGDISLDSMKVHFVITNASGSTRLEDYADSVSIWQGSTQVGSVDAADFNRDSAGVYTKTVALSNSIVRADDTEAFYVTIDAQSNLDSGDIDTEVMTVDIDNMRFTDGSGVTTTDSSTGVINAMNVTVDFVTFSASSDTELKISLDNSPSAGYVAVDSSDDTDDVVLLKGEFEVEGDSDVWMDALPILFTGTAADGANGSLTAITGSVTLKLGSNTYTESVSATNCMAEAAFTATEDCSTYAQIVSGILFDDLDYTIEAGDTVSFEVTADINNLSNTGVAATDFDAGDSLKAEFTTTIRGLAAFVVENEEGDALAAGEKSGTALGEAQTFYSDGVTVDMGTVTYAVVTDGANTEQITYTIPLTVTAFGDTRYLGLSADLETDHTTISDGMAFSYAFQESSDASTDIEAGGTLVSTSTFDCDADIEATTAYRLDEGEAVDCTLQVIMTAPPTASRSYRVHVEGVQTNTLAALTDGATELIQLLTPTQDFQTGYKFITS